MEPKYLLIYETVGSYHFAIYEQANIGGKIGQRLYNRYGSFEMALLDLAALNEGEPILLAYSNKPIDNTFKV